MSAPPGRTESKSESHARPLVEDGCTYSTTESYSCRLVEDEGGKCRECVRTRSTVRHCLGRCVATATQRALPPLARVGWSPLSVSQMLLPLCSKDPECVCFAHLVQPLVCFSDAVSAR